MKKNLLLLLISCIFTLLLCETVFRYISYKKDSSLFDSLDKIRAPIEQGSEATLGNLIRSSNNPKIIYELKPGLSVVFRGKPLTINADGFRGKLYSKEKSHNTIRLVGSGDSEMFGWGVKDDETFMSYLQESLNKKYQGCSWETINLAVPGYNTVMEIEILKDKGLQYNPDLVIIEFIGNDLNLPHFIRVKENYLTLRKSFLWAFLMHAWKKPELPDGLWFIPDKFYEEYSDTQLQHIPEQYRNMLGIDAYRKVMTELKDLSNRYGFSVLVAAQHFPENIRDICATLNFHMVEVAPVIYQYTQEHAVKDWLSIMTISKSDPHSTPLAHRLKQIAIFNYMETSGLINSLLKKNNSNSQGT